MSIQSERNSSKKGHFKHGDVIERILACGPNPNAEMKIFMEILWKRRKDGSRPGNSILSSEEISRYDSNTVLDYYENLITFV